MSCVLVLSVCWAMGRRARVWRLCPSRVPVSFFFRLGNTEPLTLL